jgi:hemin uptake protein HemP
MSDEPHFKSTVRRVPPAVVPCVEQPRVASRSALGAQLRPVKDRVVSSAALLAGSRQLWIEHSGAMYRLQVTVANKLILTK